MSGEPDYIAGSLARYLETDQGRSMDPTTYVCALGMLNLLGIVNLLSLQPAGQAPVAADGPRKPADAQLMAQTLSGLMQGQGGQKINPSALVGLLNMLSGGMDRGAPGKADQKVAEESPPTRLEPRADSAKGSIQK